MKLKLFIISLVILSALCSGAVAYALAEPDTMVISPGTLVFNSLLVSGDWLAVVPYEVSYTTEPDENIDQTYIFRILDSSNTTEYGSVLAYPAYNGGYGHGIVAFYFASGMTWLETYTLRIQQNPVYYPGSVFADFQITQSNYSTASDQAEGLRLKILDVAAYLSTQYSVELTEQSEAGSLVLSTYGELYFLHSIPGLQGMSSDLFAVQLENPDYTKRTWSTSYADTMREKYDGTFIGDFFSGYAGLWGLESTTAASTFLSIMLVSALIYFSVWKGKASMLAACTDGYALLLCLTLDTFFGQVAAGGIAFASVAMGGVILFLNKS